MVEHRRKSGEGRLSAVQEHTQIARGFDDWFLVVASLFPTAPLVIK